MKPNLNFLFFATGENITTLQNKWPYCGLRIKTLKTLTKYSNACSGYGNLNYFVRNIPPCDVIFPRLYYSVCPQHAATIICF